METLPALYEYATQLKRIEPRITIALYFDDTDVVYFTTHSDIGRPTGGGVQAVDGCVRDFEGAPQKLDPKNSSASIGSVSFELVDLGGAVSTILAQKNAEGKSPRHRKVVIYYGVGNYLVQSDDATLPSSYESLDWLDYHAKYTMIVKSYNTGPGFYSFTCDDVQRLEQPELFVPNSTTLLETITAEQMLIPVAELVTSTKFQLVQHDAQYSDRPGQTVGYVRIEDEVICHNGLVNDVTYGVSLNVLQRGALNTRAAGHQIDESAAPDRRTKVEEFFYLEGPALKLLYAVQTGILYGQGGATLPPNWHQGIDPSFIRLTDYENLGPLVWDTANNSGIGLRFVGLKKQSGDSFIREQIVAYIGGFRPVYSDGAIGFKKLSTVLGNSSYVFELNDDNIVNLGRLEHDLQSVINAISINWDWSFLKEQFLQTTGVIDQDSVDKYGDGEIKTFDFYGVRSSSQTSQDLRNAFDAYRSRYAGGGLKLSATVMPHVNRLEVGDIVRLTTSQLRDPLTGAFLDRVFEVQQIQPDSRSQRVTLSLFASTDRAGEFEAITATTVMQDAFYSSEGTDLATFPQVVAGVVTSDITLVGGETMGDGIFYHLGDLTIPFGVTVYVDDNVQLRIRGFLTRNGNIVGTGRGLPGGAGGTLFTQNGLTTQDIEIEGPGGTVSFDELSRHLVTDSVWTRTNQTPGVSGFLGPTIPSNYSKIQNGATTAIVYRGFPFSSRIVRGQFNAAPRLGIINRDGSEIPGLNDLDLRGTSGGGSHPLITGYGSRPNIYTILQAGFAGGAGGSGLIIICRGEAVGASSQIDLSGANGTAATPYTMTALLTGSLGDPVDICNGGGAGGAPGAYYLLIDGSNPFDSDADNVTQLRGLNGIHPGSITAEPTTAGRKIKSDEWRASEYENQQINFGGGLNYDLDFGVNGFKVQYIPAPENINTGDPEPPRYQLRPIVGGLTLVSGTPELLGSADGTIRERIRATWTESTEAQATEYEVQAKQDAQPDSAYRTVAVTTTGEAYIDVTEGIIYRVRVRVRGASNVIASEWVVSSAHEAQGKSLPPSDPPSFFLNVGPNTGVVLGFGEHPDADFLEYIITRNGSEIWRGAATVYQDGFIEPGAYTYVITARDRSGNLSAGTLSQAVTITGPSAPAVVPTYRGENYFLSVTPSPGSFPVISYRLETGGVPVATFDARYFSAKVDWAGSRGFSLIPIDAGGNEGPAATFTLSPTVPGTPAVSAQVIDNTVTLFYSSVPGSLPILRYEIYVGATFGAAVKFQDKAGDSTFTIKQENQAGNYTYWFVAIDTAGNASSPGSVLATVSSPPDYVLVNEFDEVALEFDGTLTNCYRDESGGLLMLVDDGETWSEYEGNGYSTFQAEHDAGFTLYASPGVTSASYVKTYDLGGIVSSSIITVSLQMQTVLGSPTHAVEIAYSDDNATWTTASATQVFATEFRYVRITISATGSGGDDLALITSLSVRLNLKEQSESGRATANAGDSGGTTVTFTKSWLDITSLTVTPVATTNVTAVVDFDDVPNPADFSVYLFNSSTGARVSGDFYWFARGYLSIA